MLSPPPPFLGVGLPGFGGGPCGVQQGYGGKLKNLERKKPKSKKQNNQKQPPFLLDDKETKLKEKKPQPRGQIPSTPKKI